MKKTQIAKILCAILLITTAAGCSAKSTEDKITVQEPGGSITIIDNTGSDKNEDGEAGEPGISIVRIDT